VSCLVDSLAVAADGVEDLVGGLGPDVGAGVLVPGLDPLADVGVQRADGAVRAAAQEFRGELAEPLLDEVDPRARGRCEVKVKPGVLSEPASDLGGSCGWRRCRARGARRGGRVRSGRLSAGTSGTRPRGGVSAAIRSPARS